MYRYEQEFKALFPNETEWEPSGGSNFLTHCPFHEHNESKTLAIDFETGLWHCFNPQCGAKGKGVKQMKQLYYRRMKIEEFENRLIQGKRLLPQDEEAVRYLREERGLTLEDVKPFHIAVSIEKEKHRLTGVESTKKYLLIPVFDKNGDIIAARKYLLPAYRTKDDPKIRFAWRNSPVTLYPDLPASDWLVLVEGEWDAILLRSKGFPALTTTGGQGGAAFINFLPELEGKKIFICFDCDEAGREGAEQVARALSRKSAVHVVDLGLGDGEDVTDFFVKYKKSKDDFQALLDQAEKQKKDFLDDLSMADIGAPQLNQRLLVQGRVIGAAGVHKFVYPTYSVLRCKGYGLDICENCPLNGGAKVVNVPPSHPDVIQFMEQTPEKQKRIVAAKAHIPFATKTKRCLLWEYDPDRTRFELAVPVFIESTDENAPDSKKEWSGYVVTEEAASKLKSGREALFWMTPVQDVQNDGRFMFVAEDVIPLKDDLDTFQMTDELHEKLKVFQGNPLEKIPEIARSLNENVFRFRGREELIIAYDLAYHSIIRFRNPNAPSRTVKGWVEALIIGDPGEGKSQLATDMVAYYGLGAYQDAATATPGGLTVTTVQMANKWVFRDGLLPLNDRRLVFIDEFNKMSGEDLGKLNTARSSGKITASSSAGTYEKDARARIVWITNPKDGQRIETGRAAAEFPIKLVAELFTDRGSQDRLDFAFLVLRDDPKPEFTTIPQQTEDPVYTKALCRTLILWAWTRTPDQVYFQDEAVREIRLASDRLRRRFWHANSEIELINSGERTTERIMRLAAAVAARVYSTADGVNLFVTKEHVQFVENFLTRQYEKMEFDRYIQSLRERQRFKENEESEAAENEIPKTKDEAISETKVLELLANDRLLFDGLDKGTYDFTLERESDNRTAIKYLYARGYLHTKDSRHFKFTKAFYQELEPKIVQRQTPF